MTDALRAHCQGAVQLVLLDCGFFLQDKRSSVLFRCSAGGGRRRLSPPPLGMGSRGSLLVHCHKSKLGVKDLQEKKVILPRRAHIEIEREKGGWP
jgi:hypothetical protein